MTKSKKKKRGHNGGSQNLALYERQIKAKHDIRTAFPPEVLAECALLPQDPELAEALAECTLLPHGPDPAEVFQQHPQNENVEQKAADRAKTLPERRDLRALGFVTIDGADAKDFDDAIFVEAIGQSKLANTPGQAEPEQAEPDQAEPDQADAARHGYLLRVAIADVAHYVKPGSALDREAMARGNSCYFPASVEPMLPKALSNGLCSLQPGKPRLCLVAEIEFDTAGNAGRSVFYPALIQSRARLTYEEAQAALDGEKQPDPTHCAATSLQDAGQTDLELRQQNASPGESWLPMLSLAAKLAARLMEQRRSRGALDFDLPEPLVVLDASGQQIQDLVIRKRLFTHRLIEEFMIAANEAVARYLATYAKKGLAFLYRAHPAPDPEKLASFFTSLERNGLLYPAGLSEQNEQNIVNPPQNLQRILEQAKERPEAFVVNRLLLRSQMQANYTPKPEGHFGLASDAYCHFTSPIRRYADLAVHRALRQAMALAEKATRKRKFSPSFQELAAMADSLNESERRAVEAERDMNKICATLFMQKQLEQDPRREFAGVVAWVSSYGLFVELAEFPVEAFLPLENISDDIYRLNSESQMLIGLLHGKVYRLGQTLRVRVQAADPSRLKIRLTLVRKSKSEKRKQRELLGQTGVSDQDNGPGYAKAGKVPGRKKRRRKDFKPGAVRVRKQSE